MSRVRNATTSSYKEDIESPRVHSPKPQFKPFDKKATTDRSGTKEYISPSREGRSLYDMVKFGDSDEIGARAEPKRKDPVENFANVSAEMPKKKKKTKKIDMEGESEDEGGGGVEDMPGSDNESEAAKQSASSKEAVVEPGKERAAAKQTVPTRNKEAKPKRASGLPKETRNPLERSPSNGETDKKVVPTGPSLPPPRTSTRAVAVERPLRDISQLGDLRDDAKSMRGMNSPYPYDKKTHLEMNPNTPRSLVECMAGYRSRGVIVAAYFCDTTALKQAVGSLPPPTSNDERVVLMFTDPDMLNHRAVEAMPLLQFEQSVAVSKHLPGILIASFDPTLVVTISAGHVAADHVFISPFIHREVTVLDKLSFCGELARIPTNSSLLMYKLVGEEDILHLQLITNGGDERAAHDVKMPCLEATEAVEVKLQLPVLNDSYQQYMYIELNQNFLNTFLSAAPKIFGRKGKGSSGRGKGNSVEESEEGGDARDAGRAVMFRVYVKGDTHAKLVVQTAEQKPSTTPTETTIRELRPARGKSFMTKCETGDRMYMQMLGSKPSQGEQRVSQMKDVEEEDEQEEICVPTSLDGYRAVACVIMSIDNARLIACSTQRGAGLVSRPTLLLPYAYDEALFDTNRQMQTSGSMVVYIEGNARDRNSSCYYLARAACAMDSTQELIERFDEPQSVTTFVQYYGNASNLVDQRFVLSTY